MRLKFQTGSGLRMQPGCLWLPATPAHTVRPKELCDFLHTIIDIWWNGMGRRKNAAQLLYQGISVIPVDIPTRACRPASSRINLGQFPEIPPHCPAGLFYPARLCRTSLRALRHYHFHALPLAASLPAAKSALAGRIGRHVRNSSLIYRFYGWQAVKGLLSGIPFFFHGISTHHRFRDAVPAAP